ncbi:MAG: ABC transporter permease, partial [Rhodothermales bacterium]|nr:ABC transporter permease [Rhodothermales bacterium]
MLKNYLTIAVRTLRKQLGYTVITVGGLALGLACAFLIVLFIQHERSFDRFHDHGDRIVRLLPIWDGSPKASTPAGLAPDIQAAFPDIEAFVRVQPARRPYLKVGGESRRVEGYALADPTVFEVFDGFELLRGDPATALADPHSLVLTERAAGALFGAEDPLGQTVTYGGGADLTVTGLMADPPPNSSLDFDYLGSFDYIAEQHGAGALTDYTNHNYLTFFLLRPGTDIGALEAKMTEWGRERLFEDDPDAGPLAALQPLAAIHLTPGVVFEYLPTRDPRYLYVFGAVAVLILLIAAVNFTNLATARAVQRAREVGVRKAVGADRGQLVAQFLGESVLLGTLGIAVALALVVLLLPVFNDVIGADIRFGMEGLQTVALLVGIGLAVGLLSGAYPALYLSAFDPSRVLKGELTRGSGGTWLRRGLIVFQFAVSVVLIVGTLTVHDQLRYMRAQDLGFDREQILFFAQSPD